MIVLSGLLREYYATTTSFNWRTRIGSFSFPTCGGNPTSDAYTNSDANSYTDANTDANSYTDTYANANSDANPTPAPNAPSNLAGNAVSTDSDQSVVDG